MLDPTSSGGLEPGEVLVCRTPDPSRAALFNTRTGTKRIRTGDWVHVDGSAGTVAIDPARRDHRTEG